MERFLKALVGSRRIDRIPYCPVVCEQAITRIAGINVKTLYSSPEIYAKSILMADEFYNSDMIVIPTTYAGPSEAIAFAEANDKRNAIKWFDYRPPFIDQGIICKAEEDIERLKIPDHSRSQLWKTTFATAKLIFKKTQYPAILGMGIWSLVQQLRGVNAFRDMRQNPEILMTLCEKIYESQLDLYQNWQDHVNSIPAIFYTGYAFNKTMMSFEDAMKYEGQFIKRLQKEFKIPIAFHNCGMKPYFEEVCNEIKFAAINGSHPLDINFWINFKKKFKKVTILGATIDVNQELLTGTPQDVEELVKENILNLAPGGRYGVSPVCSLPWNVPLPNIMAVYSAIEKYGYYPIGE